MSDDMTSSSTSYSTGDGSYYDPIYETTSYATDTTTYETTSYDTTSYSYEATSFEPTFDSTATYTETGSYSYDSTDWSAVSEVSTGYYDSYELQSDLANDYWNMSVDASIAGDSYLAYELNQMSLDYQSGANADWTAHNQVWSDMDTTTTVTSYDVSYDSSYAASSYDSGYSSYDTEQQLRHQLRRRLLSVIEPRPQRPRPHHVRRGRCRVPASWLL
jgi:hypothetical protein